MFRKRVLVEAMCWERMAEADKQCKRVSECSDWHARVSDSVTQIKSVGKGM